MKQSTIEKRMPEFHKIYEQIYETPFITLCDMAVHTSVSRSAISRYTQYMYESSILRGPVIAINPAENYHQYASFLTFENPLLTYTYLEEFPYMIYRGLGFGSWNLLLISEKMMDFSILKGFKTCFLRGVKGATWLSKVSFIDWDQSMEAMYKALSLPDEKSVLYEEGPVIPWSKKEWTLYYQFKDNIKMLKMPTLRENKIRFETYQKWLSQLPQFTRIYTAFYPKGLDKYFAVDFLFKSEYQKQLSTILGMLPSTSIFFSVGDYLFARLFFLNKKEKNDLLMVMFQLGERGYFTEGYQVSVVSPVGEGSEDMHLI